MADRGFKGIAANLLSHWTDSDTAMEIAGTSLGIFAEHGLDPVAVISHDTPLRDALFDVLLSLVEGGALEMRPLEDGRYAFRWRADMASAALSRETTVTIDMMAPPANLADITQLKQERDEALRREADALGRAEFAEALAAEQRRLLVTADARPGGDEAGLGNDGSKVAAPKGEAAEPEAPTPAPKRTNPGAEKARAAAAAAKAAAAASTSSKTPAKAAAAKAKAATKAPAQSGVPPAKAAVGNKTTRGSKAKAASPAGTDVPAPSPEPAAQAPKPPAEHSDDTGTTADIVYLPGSEPAPQTGPAGPEHAPEARAPRGRRAKAKAKAEAETHEAEAAAAGPENQPGGSVTSEASADGPRAQPGAPAAPERLADQG